MINASTTRAVVIKSNLLRMACLVSPCIAHAANDTSVARQPPVNTAASPNVILIMSDDQGLDSVGYLGNPQVRTPRLDALAAQSTQLTHFYVAPLSSPTRASVMTGRYHFRTGVIDTGDGRSNMRTEEFTIAELLRARGYRTGIFGKWHLGDNVPFRPMDQGFDESIVMLGGMIGRTFNPLGGASYFDPVLLREGREERFRGYITDIITDQAIDFINREKTRPFFLYLAYNVPHHPLTAKDEDIEPYRKMGLCDETARFYALISNMDKNIGRVLDELARLSLDKDTIVIFMSDNGTSGLLREKDRHRSGLRGNKAQVYEGGIRVPFCIRWPGRIEAGRKLDSNTAHIDVFPTLRDICFGSGATPPAPPLDGVSLWPLLSGAESTLAERKLFMQWHRGDNPRLLRHIAVLKQPFKLVQPVGRDAADDNRPLRFELFNLKADPSEKHDLARQQEGTADVLKKSGAAWFASLGLAAGPDGVAPYDLPLSYVGTEWENPVRLTRQDWREVVLHDPSVPRAAAARHAQSDKAHGRWLFDVRASATYEITLWFSDVLDEDGVVHLKINGVEYTRNMTVAECAVRLSKIPLAAGKTTLEAFLQTPNERRSVRYVDMRRTDLPESIKPFNPRHSP